jgi:DNA-3-methyladenine glycosylase I
MNEVHQDTMTRCGWCESHPLYLRYHDEEWGVPLFDDRKLFEMLMLEGAQAGLSWLTILKKRENYRDAFDRFDPEKIAGYGPVEIERLMGDAGIIRNRRKIESVIRNANGFLNIRDEYGSFSGFLWNIAGNAPVQNAWASLPELPARTETSDRMSRELKRQGFNFVGSTICYAFMQAVGMVNDHLAGCFRYEEIRKMS